MTCLIGWSATWNISSGEVEVMVSKPCCIRWLMKH